MVWWCESRLLTVRRMKWNVFIPAFSCRFRQTTFSSEHQKEQNKSEKESEDKVKLGQKLVIFGWISWKNIRQCSTPMSVRIHSTERRAEQGRVERKSIILLFRHFKLVFVWCTKIMCCFVSLFLKNVIENAVPNRESIVEVRGKIPFSALCSISKL